MTQADAAGLPPLTFAPPTVHRYIPMLKTKSGETTALENLSNNARARIMPLFHICEEVKPRFIPSLSAAWAGRLTAVDGSFNYGRTNSPNTMNRLVAGMRSSGIPTMPCWGPSDMVAYQYVARALVDGNGAVVKVRLNEIDGIASWLALQNLPPAMVDLIIDLKHMDAYDVGSLPGIVVAVCLQQAPTLGMFRSVTLAAAAAPKDHGALYRGVNLVPRFDWSLWNSVRPNVPFRLDYGDYLTGHPDLTEPPGVAMASATVSARYTLDNAWMIIKGWQTSGPNGLPMRQQYHSHATIIANDPGFSGVPNVWADGQIGQAASGAQGMASRAKWSGFAANRHMSLVADRLP